MIADLQPRMQILADTLLGRARAAGIPLTVTCTLRSMEEQTALYAQGRTTHGPIVTNARPGYSYHNFGLAFDVVPDRLIKLKNWGETSQYREEARALWDQLGALGEDIGLTWGGNFKSLKDRPHFEWSGGLSLAQLRSGARPAALLPPPTQKD